jgi:hypothetical protein
VSLLPLPKTEAEKQAFTKSLGTASLFMQSAGALSSAIGNYYAAKMGKAQLKFDSKISALNARYAEQAAAIEQSRGVQRRQGSQLAIAALKSKQRLGFASNGVDMSSDSAARILAGTDLVGEVDALTIDQDTMEAVWNQKREASNLRNRSATEMANSHSLSPGMAGFSSLLGDASQVASSWYSYRKTYK